MPEHRNSPEELERFHAALDRLAAGAPVPLFDDPELQELLELGGRLRQELPADMPDPAFRAALKSSLLEQHTPGIVPHPRRNERVAARASRVPYMAVASAFAVVLVAAIAVGAFALMRSDGDDRQEIFADVAGETETARVSVMSTLASPTEDVPTVQTFDVPPSPEVADEPSPTQEEQTPVPEPATVTVTVAPEPTETDVATLVATALPTVSPTVTRQLAVTLPPINATTVESGPVPAADPGAGGASPSITYELATELPDLGQSAPVFLLAPPDEDPVALVTGVARELGVRGEVQTSEINGRVAYHIGDDAGTTFHWWPDTGAFAFSSIAEDSGAEMSEDEVVESCQGWLRAVGYPVDRLNNAISANPVDNTSWLVETALDTMPQPGFGHPLGVRMIVNSEGQVVDARGYWLAPEDAAEIELISAQEAWTALTAHQGYWFGAGGAFSEGGTFRVEAIELSYVLTSATEGLVLQPVIAMRGELVHADGVSSSGVTVFIQGARSEARYSGP